MVFVSTVIEIKRANQKTGHEKGHDLCAACIGDLCTCQYIKTQVRVWVSTRIVAQPERGPVGYDPPGIADIKARDTKKTAMTI